MFHCELFRVVLPLMHYFSGSGWLYSCSTFFTYVLTHLIRFSHLFLIISIIPGLNQFDTAARKELVIKEMLGSTFFYYIVSRESCFFPLALSAGCTVRAKRTALLFSKLARVIQGFRVKTSSLRRVLPGNLMIFFEQYDKIRGI